MRFIVFAIFIFLVSASFQGVKTAQAQTITPLQDLEFGEAVLTNNSAPREIIVDQDGSYSSDPQYLFVTLPQAGVYEVTGQTPGTPITSVVITVIAHPNATGRQFTIDNFDIVHPATIDGAGEAIIRVGARLQSSGNGTTYPASTIFNGNLQLTVNY